MLRLNNYEWLDWCVAKPWDFMTFITARDLRLNPALVWSKLKKIALNINMLVSALLTPFGPFAKVLDMVLIGNVLVLYDDRIFTEYAQVLRRPKFGFDKHAIRDVLDYLFASGERVVAGVFNGKIIDVCDLPFVEVARRAKADAVVTGNKKHFSQRDCGCLVLSPVQLINQ